jgi:hypothetical protein
VGPQHTQRVTYAPDNALPEIKSLPVVYIVQEVDLLAFACRFGSAGLSRLRVGQLFLKSLGISLFLGNVGIRLGRTKFAASD